VEVVVLVDARRATDLAHGLLEGPQRLARIGSAASSGWQVDPRG
jgi:hypothetical protein